MVTKTMVMKTKARGCLWGRVTLLSAQVFPMTEKSRSSANNRSYSPKKRRGGVQALPAVAANIELGIKGNAALIWTYGWNVESVGGRTQRVFLRNVVFVMLSFIFSLCCIIKFPPDGHYLHFYVIPMFLLASVNSSPPGCTYTSHPSFSVTVPWAL